MNIAICEDNAADAVKIEAYLLEHFEKNCFAGDIRLFPSGEALLDGFAPGAFDVIFLDIYMGGMNGVETARKIRAADPYCALIFITVSPDHMPEGFAVRAASYVVKPIKPEDMATALLQCRSIFLKNARYIEVVSDRQTIKIPLVKIYYVESEARAVLFHTEHGVIKANKPLDEIEEQLGGRPFLRCHRSFLVNMNHVSNIYEYDMVMRNGAHIPLRKNGRKEIRAEMGGFMTDRMFEAQ